MKAEYIPSKYRRKVTIEEMEQIDKKLIDLVKNHTGICLENMPERVKTKCTHEENIYIPEKWIR